MSFKWHSDEEHGRDREIELATGGGDEDQPLWRRFVSSGQLQCKSLAWVDR